MNSWYAKQKLPLFIFAIICLIFSFTGREINFGKASDSRYNVFTIEFEYFGMDAGELEKTITLPLEEKITEITGLAEMRSVSENGKTAVTTWFDKSISSKKIYLNLRNLVDNLYAELPSAVQKPRIYSAQNDSKAIFSFTVSSRKDLSSLRQFIDSTIKKQFESIQGVADVIVAGGAIKELTVKFDPDILVSKNLNPQVFAQIVQDANVVYSGSVLHLPQNDHKIQFDTKLQTIEQIRKLPVKLNERYITIDTIADIDFSNRVQEEIVRINGEEAVSVQIKASSDANIIKTSKQCNEILEKSGIPKENYTIITDEGAIQKKLIKRLLFAILQSYFFLILVVPLFYSEFKTIFLILLSIPFTIFWTILQLSTLGISLDANCLSGLSISIGLIADPMLVISEQAELCRNKKHFASQCKFLLPSLFSSTITSLLAIIPLYNANYIVHGIRSILTVIILMLCNSTVIATVFFPCFIFAQKRHNFLSISLLKPVKNRIEAFLKILLPPEKNNSKPVLIIYALMCVLPFFFLLFSGKNITQEAESDILYVSIEYPPEKKVSFIDGYVKNISDQIEKNAPLNFLISECRQGNAQIEIGFNSENISKEMLAEKILSLSSFAEDGMIFIQNLNHSNKQRAQEFEIAITGEESRKCRELASKASEFISRDPQNIETVLNFKQNPKEIELKIDARKNARLGLSTQDIANTLHWMLFGPVVDKWIRNNNEYDIRILSSAKRNLELQDFKNLPIPTKTSNVKLSALGEITVKEGNGKIYRLNGRRCAFFTVKRAGKSTTKNVNELKKQMQQIGFPRGYDYHFSKEIEKLQEQFLRLIVLTFFSVAIIFLYLTAATQNFKKTLLMISIIPASAFIPFLIKFITQSPLHPGDLIGLTISSGIVINNSIYLSASKIQTNKILNERIRSILSTTITTILGAAPILFSPLTGFPKDIAFFMFWASINSLLTSIILYPRIISAHRG
ncbi:efflux RND transporter permease subunit [Treponema parvum]|uniref:efflux RND transporter permease subunit n=1 Tax=Treponema parvum TaxID=138851 RepID=UPI001AEBEC92|nr:efflux RND transporter permease subunit [Treponema parvum]QTQ17208.1 efflux RND transporter permease subunit [Treponema parvum]